MVLDTAVIPCGGLARRLRPVSHWVPKEMLPVGLKPLLYWALDEAADAGLLRVILVTNPHKPIVEAAARHYQGPLELEFVPQPSFRGLGDAIRCAREALAGSPFVVLQPDQLLDGANGAAQVADAFRRGGETTVLLGEVPAGQAATTSALGLAETLGDGGVLRIRALGARGDGAARFPAAGGLAPFGRVAWRGDVFAEFDAAAEALPPGAELDDRPVLQRLAARGALAGVRSAARLFDAGNPDGYRAAVAHWPARVG